MSQSRTRAFSIPGASGTQVQNSNGALINTVSAADYSKTTSDVVGNWNSMNAFETRERSVTYDPINRIHGLYTLKNFPPDPVKGGYFNVQHISTGFMDTTQAIALTNPGEPLVDIPNFLFELKDLPSMLKHVGNRAMRLVRSARAKTPRDIFNYLRDPRNPAEDWLNYNFGWRPFYSDLKQLPGLQEDIQKRLRQLTILRNQGWVSSRRQMGKRSTHSTGSATYLGISPGLSCNSQTNIITKKWLVARWKNNALAFGAMTDREKWNTMYRASLGLDFNISHAWDLMPWSWLIDWFTEAGNVVHILSNRFGWTFVQACLCSSTERRDLYFPREHSPQWATQCQRLETVKTRSLVTPSILPAVFGNYLNAGQLTTLASLATPRAVRRTSF